MRKIFLGFAILLSMIFVFAADCQGKYVITGQGFKPRCADDCADAKSIAAGMLMSGASSVRIDARGGYTVNRSCDGKTYTSVDQIK